MACDHKFRGDLLLQNLDFEPTRLVVGTFNPAWPATNTAPWFYGRTSNNCFWDIVPRLQGQPSLINGVPSQWKRFCSQEKIAITDLISCIKDADPANPVHVRLLATYADSSIASDFYHHLFVDIIELIDTHPSIQKVYLTRGATEFFWKSLWKRVERYCAHKGIYCTTLLTPSGNARFQVPKGTSLCNHVFSKWAPLW